VQRRKQAERGMVEEWKGKRERETEIQRDSLLQFLKRCLSFHIILAVLFM
jgi:hypothetical protein